MSEKWTSCTVKLECLCTFSVPPATYYDWYPDKDAECDTHGKTQVMRVSRLGTK